MARDPEAAAPAVDASSSVAPGSVLRIEHGSLVVGIAAEAGGRLAQVTFAGEEWLAGYSAANAAMIAWGCYPMLPWAGRVRGGRFVFDGTAVQLATNLGDTAIHGVGFALPWRVEAHSPRHVELSLDLPADERWPFGGRATQRIEAAHRVLRMQLSVTAGRRAMPAVIGWHPWFRKPDRFVFRPLGAYSRDAEGIVVPPLTRQAPPAPWDDCFINEEPVLIEREGQRVRLTSDCRHWVVYDAPDHATCIEPQSGPPDAFNLEPTHVLAPGSSLAAWFVLEWL